MSGALSCGIPEIDTALGGGLHPGELTHIFGPSGSGKTTLALHFAVNLSHAGGSTIYVTPEADFVGRLSQIVKNNFPDVAQRILVYGPSSFNEQSDLVDRLDSFATPSIKLIIFDTITRLYRRELETRRKTIVWNHELNRQTAELSSIAKEHAIPVILINEVAQDIDDQELKPVARSILSYWCRTSIEMRPVDPPQFGARWVTITTPLATKTIKIQLTQQGIIIAR